MIRAAKEALNGIDPIDVNKSYRFEQGFTFELNLAGRQRRAARRLRGDGEGEEVTKGPRDKRMTIDEVVAELEDGMTIGIGGWGPRRKPMALVRAILRSDLKDLTLVSWGGADVGLLVRAGKIRKLVYAFVSPRLGPARAELPEGPPGGHHPRGRRARRGHVPDRPARRRPAAAVPADARRARLRRAGQQPVDQDRHQPVRRRAGAGRRARAQPRRRAGAPEPRRPARQRDLPRPGPLLRRPLLHGRRPRATSRASRSSTPPASPSTPRSSGCCSAG